MWRHGLVGAIVMTSVTVYCPPREGDCIRPTALFDSLLTATLQDYVLRRDHRCNCYAIPQHVIDPDMWVSVNKHTLKKRSGNSWLRTNENKTKTFICQIISTCYRSGHVSLLPGQLTLDYNSNPLRNEFGDDENVLGECKNFFSRN